MNTHKVIWQEGMLLRPQHLQQSDRYFDGRINSQTRLLHRHFWGFFELVIDTQFLGMSKLVITRASGVLPDGSFFDIDGSNERLTLDIESDCANLSVYLGLPLSTGDSIEARTADQRDVLTRYLTYQTTVFDSNAGTESACDVSCARPDLRLLTERQLADQPYVKLKLCELTEVTASGGIKLNPEYVPTYLHVHASEYLLSSMNEVSALLAHRGEKIAARVQAGVRGGAAEVGDFMMLQMINRTELSLRNLQSRHHLHPDELYEVLLALLGELVTFCTETKRPRLESFYDHADQAGSLRKVLGPVRQMLSMVLEQHAVELELQVRQYGVLVAVLPDRSMLGSATFVLAVSAACDGEELRKRLPAHLKVAPVESIRELVNLHLPGIRVKPLPVAPRQIPFHANKTYFMLELHARELAQLENSGGFAFHVSGDFADLKMNFWAIRS
jgi:type VI secretion system protein ImpJ